MPPVRVGVVDIGSNTARLLVADAGAGGGVAPVFQERVYLRLGDDIHATGGITERKLAATASATGRFARRARDAGAVRVETIVTAPGRQAANADALVETVRSATAAPVAVLAADDEGRLAWEGAVARADDVPDVVTVVDLGGGSLELATGTPTLGPAWVRSLELGALLVTRTWLHGDPPAPEGVAAARRDIRRQLARLAPPSPDLALAVGGTARALGRILGRSFTADDLDGLAAALARTPAREVAAPHGVSRQRTVTLLGGALVLAAASRALEAPLEVGRGGVREGAALALAHAPAVAA
jgi:exopolyphosphatase/guanosine-5'-triphosphate,3'-diphosphate pyrophosphatase